MIQKTKGTKLPKSEPHYKRNAKAVPPAKKAKPEFADATSVDVEEAKSLLLRLRPDLRSAVINRTLTEASQAIENRLVPFHGETWQSEPTDGMLLQALHQGLFVSIDDRRGVIPYEEIAQDLLDNADVDDEAETALDSNGPPVKEGLVASGERRAKKLEPLCTADEVVAIEYLERSQPTACFNIMRERDDDTAALIARNLLFGHGYHVHEPGGVSLVATANGLCVTHQGRHGTIAFERVAELIRDRSEDEGGETALGGAETKPAAGETTRGKTSRKGAKAQKQTLDTFEDIDFGPSGPGEQLLTVAVKLLEPNPFQPRLAFDPAEIKSLAASIAAGGQRQPVEVRPHPTQAGRYQIKDGERRWRAIQSSKGHTVQVIVRAASDEEMLLHAMDANLERADLTAIEIARQFQRLVERGWTQAKIGERFGCSAPEVSNKLRLLSLPEAWQKRILSREMPATHGRCLVPYCQHAAILESMAKQLKKDPEISLVDWEDALDNAVRENSRPLSGYFSFYEGKGYVRGNVEFRPNDAQKAALQIIEVKGYGGKQSRCLNVKLWTELQAAGVQRKAEREEKAAAKKGKTVSAKTGKPVKQKSASELAARFAKRLYTWKADWLRYECHQVMRECLASGTQGDVYAAMKVVLWAAAEKRIDFDGHFPSTNAQDSQFRLRSSALEVAMLESNGKKCEQISECERDASVENVALIFVASLLWDDKEGPQQFLPADVVEWLAEDLSIDLADAWKKSLAGPLTQEYFELHSKEQLGAIGKELKVSVDVSKPKGEIVTALIAAPATKKRLPAEIAKAKRSGSRR